MKSFTTVFLTAAVALSLPAQDPAPQAPPPAPTTVATGPILVLKTSEMDVADGIAMLLEHEDPLPDLPENGSYVLSLGADRKLQVTTAAGAVGMLELEADPGALMEVFAKDIEGGKAIVRGSLTLGLQQTGMSPKEVATIVNDVLDFPKQMRRISLRIEGDPNAMEDGLTVTIDVDGKAGSALATLIGKLQPCSQGAPVMPATGAATEMALSLSPESLAAVFEPFRQLGVRFISQDDAQQQRASAMWDKWMAAYDGGMSAVLGEGLRVQALIGLLDGEQVRKMLASEEYVEMIKNQKMPMRDMEVEVTVDALEHRGVKMTKSRITGAPPSPIATDGTMETLVGVAGNHFVMAMGGDAGAKALVDAVLDDKVKRAPLPDGALARISMDVAALFGAFVPGGQQLPPDAPEKVTMSVTRRGEVLRLTTRIE